MHFLQLLAAAKEVPQRPGLQVQGSLQRGEETEGEEGRVLGEEEGPDDEKGGDCVAFASEDTPTDEATAADADDAMHASSSPGKPPPRRKVERTSSMKKVSRAVKRLF